MNIQELKTYFENIEIPKGPIQLDPATKINDVAQFIRSHFAPLLDQPDSKMNEPLLWRLARLKEYLEAMG